MSELAKTVELMLSPDYKERFVAEYMQLKIRSDKLLTMVNKYEANELDFIPSCSLELLKRQLVAMLEYKSILIERAEIEGVELPVD